MNKLYGHPHEIEAVARSKVSQRMASCCSALSQQSASVVIWDTSAWKILKILKLHNYTVYDMAFSSHDKYFASVSKDRKLAVYNG